MMAIEWDGFTKSKGLNRDEVVVRHQLADAAKHYDWQKAFEILNKRPDLINTTRPDGHSQYSPLHQASYGNAPVEVVQAMLTMGAWRTLRNAKAERALDIAKKKQYQQLIELLEPVYKRQVPNTTIQKIQQHFHSVILGRAANLVQEYELRLPKLDVLLELEKPHMWFPIPGMFGGFDYQLEIEGQTVKLVAESWCRVVGGSGQRHEITEEGSKLVDEGFV